MVQIICAIWFPCIPYKPNGISHIAPYIFSGTYILLISSMMLLSFSLLISIQVISIIDAIRKRSPVTRIPFSQASCSRHYKCCISRFPAMVFISSSTTMGFDKCPFIPASIDSCTSSANAFAVMAIMGIVSPSGRSFK